YFRFFRNHRANRSRTGMARHCVWAWPRLQRYDCQRFPSRRPRAEAAWAAGRVAAAFVLTIHATLAYERRPLRSEKRSSAQRGSMKATYPFSLLCPALAVLTGLVLGAGVCFAQPPPPVRLGDPFQPGSPPAAPVPAPQNTVPPPAVQIGPPQPNASLPGPAAPGPPGVEPQLRVGEVKVLGNRWTKERVIRRQIPLEPGQVLSLPDLRLAEYNIAMLGIVKVDPLHGNRQTV